MILINIILQYVDNINDKDSYNLPLKQMAWLLYQMSKREIIDHYLVRKLEYEAPAVNG